MEWEVVAEDLGFIEGPVWDAGLARLSVVSIDKGCIFHFGEGGEPLGDTATGGGPNGMVLSGEGLLVAQNGGIFGGSGPAVPGVQRVNGDPSDYLLSSGFDAPNDLAFGPDGLLYVTDPASEKGIFEPIPGRVHACDLATGECRTVIEGRFFPNGLAFTADGSALLLALTQPRHIERFALTGGALVSEGIFCELTNGRPDGLAIDEAGQLWACTPGTGGIEVFGPDGSFVRRIEIGAGSMITNLCFGGEDGRDLFVTAAGWGKLLRLRPEVRGLALRKGGAA